MKLNVFLLGGGTRLAAHLGALQAIQEEDVEISGWAGASAGSLIAAVRAAGYTHDMALDLMLNTNYRQFFDLRPLELLRSYGLCSGNKLQRWLNVVLRGSTFGTLETPLAVACTNVETGAPFIFSTERTPEANVAAAVRCSVGIPGLFAVRRMMGALLVDGGLIPVDESQLFTGANPTLTIRLVRDRGTRPMRAGFGWTAYVQRIASLLLDAGDDPRFVPAPSQETLTIRTGAHSAVDFDLSADEKRELYDMGYRQCRAMLDLTGGWSPQRPATETVEFFGRQTVTEPCAVLNQLLRAIDTELEHKSRILCET